MKRKYKIILFAIIAMVGIVAYGTVMIQPKYVEAEPVKQGDLTTSFTTQGTVLPKHSQIINSSWTGVVKEIPYQAGTEVAQGSVILHVGYENQADLEIQREQYRQQLTSARQTYDRLFGVNGTAKANLESAQSDYDLADRNYQNGKILVGETISQMELDVLEHTKKQAKQALIQAQEEHSQSNRDYYQQLIVSYEKQLNALEQTVNPGELTMPYDGVIWEVYQEEGMYVGVNQPVVKIYQPNDMKIQALLLSEDALRLTPGQIVSCKYTNGAIIEAEVQFISTVAGQTLSTIGMEENRCIVEFKPESVPVGVGAGHQVDIICSLIAAEQVLSVPTSALISMADGSGVYVIDHGKAVVMSVETGKKSGGRTEIIRGVSEGDMVVTDPYDDGVKAGDRIKVKILD